MICPLVSTVKTAGVQDLPRTRCSCFWVPSVFSPCACRLWAEQRAYCIQIFAPPESRLSRDVHQDPGAEIAPRSCHLDILSLSPLTTTPFFCLSNSKLTLQLLEEQMHLFSSLFTCCGPEEWSGTHNNRLSTLPEILAPRLLRFMPELVLRPETLILEL